MISSTREWLTRLQLQPVAHDSMLLPLTAPLEFASFGAAPSRTNTLVLIQQYYYSDDTTRQAEIDQTLARNMNNSYLTRGASSHRERRRLRAVYARRRVWTKIRAW